MQERPSNIRVNIKNFRAIKNAAIIIDGITVVAGENGCGKSSISKLLYYYYRTASNYEVLIRKELYAKLQEVVKFLDILYQELYALLGGGLRNSFRKEFTKLRKGLMNTVFLDEQLDHWHKLVDLVESIYFENNFKLTLDERGRTSRLEAILHDVLGGSGLAISLGDYIGLGDGFSILKDLIFTKFKEADGKIQSRPTSLFTQELKAAFSDSVLPSTFEVLEYESLMVSLGHNSLAIPYSVQKAIYIDTPVIMDVKDSSNEHWKDLKDLIIKNGRSNDQFSDLIQNDIIHGKAIVKDDDYSSEEFKFRRDDGAIFDLLDVATGIKSFSIIQLLLNKDILNDKTLLILDEPESHLHPQWIIEYARIIVLLNKRYGVKFFVASHNPDMVSAIRYISEKEKTLERLNCYLAEKVAPYSYDYRHLGIEIDPIFESFNIALDRMNQYGISEL